MLRHIRHTTMAAQYSKGGFFRLMQETAAQAEVLFYATLLVFYLLIGASPDDYCILTFLFLVTLGLEALNTAIEVLVDHLTTEFADFAREAKDLGSFAVFCGLSMMSLYSLFLLVRIVLA